MPKDVRQTFVRSVSKCLLLAGLDGVVTFLDQLFHRDVHLLTSEVVDGQALHYAVRVVGLDRHREAVDQTFLNAVRPIRRDAHRHPLPLQQIIHELG